MCICLCAGTGQGGLHHNFETLGLMFWKFWEVFWDSFWDFKVPMRNLGSFRNNFGKLGRYFCSLRESYKELYHLQQGQSEQHRPIPNKSQKEDFHNCQTPTELTLFPP